MAAVIPNVSRVSARIIRILGCNPGPMTLQGTNTYLIGTGKKRILLDAGEGGYPQYIHYLRTVLESEHIALSHIFISHWHRDHIGGVPDVLELENNTKDCQIWKYPRAEDDRASLEYLHFEDGQQFCIEGATLRVLHTPGHTKDHVAFHLAEENAIFCGDCILGEGTSVFEDLPAYIASLDILRKENPRVMYPGHGNVIHDPKERIDYYLAHRDFRDKKILQILQENSKGFTANALVHKIYTETPTNLLHGATNNVLQHLDKLKKEGKICYDRKSDRWRYNCEVR